MERDELAESVTVTHRLLEMYLEKKKREWGNVKKKYLYTRR